MDVLEQIQRTAIKMLEKLEHKLYEKKLSDQCLFKLWEINFFIELPNKGEKVKLELRKNKKDKKLQE